MYTRDECAPLSSINSVTCASVVQYIIAMLLCYVLGTTKDLFQFTVSILE